MNYCRRCGTQLTQQAHGAYTCENSHRVYASPSPSVNVFFLTDDNHVLLSVRGIEPYKGTLDGIGGFIDPGENAEDALVREIHEETGLTRNEYGPLNFICTIEAPYLYDSELRDTLPIFFWTRLAHDAEPKAADDISSVVRFPLFDPPLDELAKSKISIPFKRLQDLMRSEKSL